MGYVKVLFLIPILFGIIGGILGWTLGDAVSYADWLGIGMMGFVMFFIGTLGWLGIGPSIPGFSAAFALYGFGASFIVAVLI